MESLFERVNKKFNQGVVIGNSLYDQSTIIGKRLDDLLEAKAALSRETAQLRREGDNNAEVMSLPTESAIESVALESANDSVVTDEVVESGAKSKL